MEETIRACPVKHSESRAETYHHSIGDRSNKGITEKKADGTCAEIEGVQGQTSGERDLGNVSRTSIPQGRGGTEEQTL